MDKVNLFELPRLENEDGSGISLDAIKESLTRDQYIKWLHYFRGKTGGVTNDGKFFVFDDDWERFLQNELGLLKA